MVLEQRQLITELQLFQRHLEELESEIVVILASAREARILLSISGIGPIQAAMVLAAIGHIDNFASAAALKSYFGWAPSVSQSGQALDKARLTHGGTRTVKHALYLSVALAIHMDCE